MTSELYRGQHEDELQQQQITDILDTIYEIGMDYPRVTDPTARDDLHFALDILYHHLEMMGIPRAAGVELFEHAVRRWS